MNSLEQLIGYIQKEIVLLTVTVGLVFLHVFLRAIIRKIINRHATMNKMAYSREAYVKKLINIIQIILFLTILGFVWDISIKGLSIYFASIFTVIGVGLFATWSILSNLTASVILFFFFPYRIGGRIKIIDGENSIEGEVLDITLFFIQIKTETGDIYSCPNNLAIQKPIKNIITRDS